MTDLMRPVVLRSLAKLVSSEYLADVPANPNT